MANWKKGFDSDFIVSELEHWIVRDGSSTENSIKIAGFGYSRELLLLTGAVDFDQQVPESEARRIVSRSVTAVAHKRELTSKSLLSEFKRREKIFVSKPEEKFKLHTTISLPQNVKIKRTYISGSYISIGGRVSADIKKARADLYKKAGDRTLGEYPNRYQSVGVTVTAKTSEIAAQTALDRLNYLRGLWNIQINRGSYRESHQRPAPVNRMILGPMHTIHSLGGELLGDQFWYDNNYQGPIGLFEESKRIEYFDKYARNVLRIDKTHAYSQDLRGAVRRYAEVLDGRDMNAVMLGLWGILELLTDTQRKNYDVLIDRASFVFEDHKKARHTLQLIRLRRNEYAHDGSTSSGAETLVYQLKSFVETLIGFHFGLAERYRFKDMKEFAKILDFPPDRSKHDVSIELARVAYEVRYGSE